MTDTNLNEGTPLGTILEFTGTPTYEKYFSQDIQIARKFAKIMYREFGTFIRALVLFGSTVKGTRNIDSDIDLLVIKETSKRRPFRVKEIFEALRGMKREFPLDAIVYTPDEIQSRLKIGDYFVTEAMTQGKVMYAG